MIVSKSNRFVFIHNPKAAGSSVRDVLLDYNDFPIELWHQKYIPDLQRTVDMSHLSAQELNVVLRQEGYPPGFLNNVFTFGFVRNPYSRFLSSLKEFSRQNSVDLSTPGQIAEFVDRYLHPAVIQYDWNFSHFRPQHLFFYSGTKRVVDFLGRFHHLHQDWATICANLNITVTDLPHKRDTGSVAHVNYPQQFLEARTLRSINRLYAQDWMLLAPYFTETMECGLPTGSHRENVENVRSPLGRRTYYGEPPGLSLGEKVGFLTEEVDRLRAHTRKNI